MDRSITIFGFLALAVALALAPGCQRLREHKWRGHGYGAEQNAMTKNLRPAADEKQMTGFDERARDIERSLGVR